MNQKISYTNSALSLLIVVLSQGCSVWASDEYEFVERQCTVADDCPDSAPFSTPVCLANGRCDLECDEGRASCDDNPTTGCEVDISSIENCGGCGNACLELNGNRTSCDTGVCNVTCIDDDYRDCDGDAANGCELNITTPMNCGGCGVRCGDGEFCTETGEGYECIVGCTPPNTVCGGSCILLTSNRQHCGRCGNACGNANTATDSVCEFGLCLLECDAGFEDCDMEPPNGCEAPLDTIERCGSCDVACDGANADWTCDVSGAPVCAATCNADFLDCNDDVSDGCEAPCANINSAGPACAAGACVLNCQLGFDSCDGSNASGCETDITTTTNCGSCGNACAAPMVETWTCGGSGTCLIETCAAGTADCNGDAADGCEVVLATDTDHCGGCGIDCPEGTCESGACVPAISDPVIEMAAGLYHTCLVRQSGATYCAGINTNGQVGVTSPATQPTPQQVAFSDGTPLNASRVAAANFHTCAIDAGRLVCWGYNGQGQLGRAPTTTAANLPEFVQADPSEAVVFSGRSFLEIDTYHRHTCALDSMGEVWCWGEATGAKLGETLAVPTRLAMRVSLPRPAQAISVGYSAAIATLDDGTLVGWGGNATGALGFDRVAQTVISTPTLIPGAADVTSVSIGQAHTCFVDGAAAELFCMGEHTNGRLGSTGGPTDSPRRVSLTNPLRVQVGYASTCAETMAGVFCWGRGNDGALGSGVFESGRVMPEPIVFPVEATMPELTGKAQFAHCAISQGIPYCWGYNAYGGLNPSGDEDWSTVSASPEDSEGTVLDLAGIAVSAFHGCGWTSDALFCWGTPVPSLTAGSPESNSSAHLPLPVPLPAGVSALDDVSVGYDHTCALAGGTAYCGGFNGNVQLVQAGGSTRSLEPIALPGLVDEISAGDLRTCVRQGGLVYCVGSDAAFSDPWDSFVGGSSLGDLAELGDETPVAGLSDAVQIAAGSQNSCARRSGGQVYCWGAAASRGDGPGGEGDVLLPAGRTAVDIDTGEFHSCAVLDSTEVVCWGSGFFGRLGHNADSSSNVPVYVVDAAGENLVGAVEVALMAGASCARKADGTLWCWGINTERELGDLSGADRSLFAIERAGISDATSINAGSRGSRHLCFTRSGADGQGSAGCVGNRSVARSGAPTPLPRVAAPQRFRDLPGID